MSAKNIYVLRHFYKRTGRPELMPPLPPRKQLAEFQARSGEIFERWLAGEKLEAIGDSYGLTRERVRQIVGKASYTDDPKILEQIALRRTGKLKAERAANRERIGTKAQLKALFETGFDREKIIRLLEMTDDPDIYTCSDLELCEMVFGVFKIKRFFKYFRCTACEDIKPKEDFAPSITRPPYNTCQYCRTCQTDRHRQTILDHPEYTLKASQKQKQKPNLVKIYTLRSYLRHQGRDDEIPPLPPKGTPDAEIVVPKILQEKGESLRKWRESRGYTFNREEAAKKAKKLVREDAAARHISL